MSVKIELGSGEVARVGRVVYWRVNATVRWGVLTGVDDRGHPIVDDKVVRSSSTMRTSLDRVLADVRSYIREGAE